MNLKKYFVGLIIVLILLLSGCAANVLYSRRSSAPVGDVSRINVIFVSSNARTDSIHTLGLKIAEKFPLVFSANEIASEAKSLPPAEIPNSPAEYRQLFSKTSDTGLILYINPISATTNCYGGCVSQFRVQTNLFRAQAGTLLWSAMIDLPYPDTRWSGYSGVAEKFANTLLERLRVDGVIPSKTLTK